MMSSENKEKNRDSETKKTENADAMEDAMAAKAFAREAWERYCEEVRSDEIRQKEVRERCMSFGKVCMRYGMEIIGEPDENGYPVYIALHGGGKDPDGRVNDQQWRHMGVYYKDSVKNGIYINPRGVRDTWDTHANPESFPLYDRLIENLAVFYGADLNRVYLLGFSAGGDGVYLVGPRMADRFAALHMSAGHPNHGSLVNLYHTPIQLQVGMNDFAYNRNQETVRYEQYLDRLQRRDPDGYIHNVYVHADKPHNFRDNSGEPQVVLTDNTVWLSGGQVTRRSVDSNAVRFLEQFTRDPLPTRLIWELNNRKRAKMRACESFYWLRVPKDVTAGKVIVRLCREENRIIVERDDTKGRAQVLLNDDMLDLDRPVTIVYPAKAAAKDSLPAETMAKAAAGTSLSAETTAKNGAERSGKEAGLQQTDQTCRTVQCTRSKETILRTLRERGDRAFLFSACVDI